MSYFEDNKDILYSPKGVYNVVSCKRKLFVEDIEKEDILSSGINAGDELPSLTSKYDGAGFFSLGKENVNPNVSRKVKRAKKQRKLEKKKEKSFCDLSDSDDQDDSDKISNKVSDSLTLSNFACESTFDYDDIDDSIILDDKHFKSIMLREINEDYITHKDDEDYIMKAAANNRIIELRYKDQVKNHYFTCKMNGKDIKINVREAYKLFSYGENELKKIFKKKVICNECSDKVLMYDSFNYGTYYLCVKCSCTDKYMNKNRMDFIDPLILEPEFNKYEGILIYCRKHKKYSHISRFTTITKDNKRKFQKECHDCRLRYKIRDKMIRKNRKEYNHWRTCRV